MFRLPGLCLLCLSLATPCLADELKPEHMVYLRSVDPAIEQDIRYASAHNFTGHPLDGYRAAECLLSADAAKALARVQAALKAEGYGLKVFDCYRPSRAVADMGRFATEPGDPRKAEFYPRLDKQDFWRLGYVARVSNHSRGGTVDLTMTGPGHCPPPPGHPPPLRSIAPPTTASAGTTVPWTWAPASIASMNARIPTPH